MFKPQNIEIIEDLWYALEMSLLEDDDDPQDEAKVNGKTVRSSSVGQILIHFSYLFSSHATKIQRYNQLILNTLIVFVMEAREFCS